MILHRNRPVHVPADYDWPKLQNEWYRRRYQGKSTTAYHLGPDAQLAEARRQAALISDWEDAREEAKVKQLESRASPGGLPLTVPPREESTLPPEWPDLDDEPNADSAGSGVPNSDMFGPMRDAAGSFLGISALLQARWMKDIGLLETPWCLGPLTWMLMIREVWTKARIVTPA